jgi:ketosteroid isomerase-like protein
VRLQVGESHWAGESKMSGTAASPLAIDGQAIEAEGARLEIDCVDVIDVRDGLIARKDTYLDAAALMRAMGAT